VCWRRSRWWFGLTCWLLAGCQTPQPRPELLRRSEPLLGTFVTITVYGDNREWLSAAVSAAFEEFRRIDSLMSIHRADSELSQVNARGSVEPVVVSADLWRVIAKAQDIAEQTEGSFDMTIRPLSDLWGFIWKQYRLPTDEQLKAVLPRVNYRLVELDAEKRTVHFLVAGVSLDLGGIAKGYAVDCAIEKLRSIGVTNAMVKAGGDLRVIGVPPGKTNWIVQLEDPAKEGRRIKIPLRHAALSTSGNYENYFEIDGVPYSHILNPHTGRPVQGIAACTVIAPTCMESDALATACFVYGVEKSLAKFGERFPMRFTLMPKSPAHDNSSIRQTASFPPCKGSGTVANSGL
jgi:thiamine biosynthesis lipoprotein